MSGAVIFTGPSLPPKEAAKFADLTYQMPAAQGDIYRAAAAGARVIGLIDGYFEGVPAVWHKEILFALARGVHVFGAASMGALRAAELRAFGMRGVGCIYEWYAEGVIDADDEVALVHGPPETDFMALSEPLVNVRATLDHAIAANVVSKTSAGEILSAARRLFYKVRTWERLLSVENLSRPDMRSFAEWLPAHRIDQKRLDAEAMLTAIADFLAKNPPAFHAEFAFEPTDAWNMGLEQFKQPAEISGLDRLILDEARLLPDQFSLLMQAAMPVVLAGRLDRPPQKSGNASRLIDAFRIEKGLLESKSFREWRAAAHISQADLGHILQARADAAALASESSDALLAEILNEIKVRGLYAQFRERAERKACALPEAGPPSFQQMPLHALLEWFFVQRLGRAMPQDVEQICRELMLPDRLALRKVLATEFTYDKIRS
jgi:hypothetical protein